MYLKRNSLFYLENGVRSSEKKPAKRIERNTFEQQYYTFTNFIMSIISYPLQKPYFPAWRINRQIAKSSPIYFFSNQFQFISSL